MSDTLAENDPGWKEACRREQAIRDLLRRYPRRMTKRAVEDVAWELGISRTTLYLLISRYCAAHTVEVLLDQPVGRLTGSLRNELVRDALIEQFLEREYLKPTRPPLRGRSVQHARAGQVLRILDLLLEHPRTQEAFIMSPWSGPHGSMGSTGYPAECLRPPGRPEVFHSCMRDAGMSRV